MVLFQRNFQPVVSLFQSFLKAKLLHRALSLDRHGKRRSIQTGVLGQVKSDDLTAFFIVLSQPHRLTSRHRNMAARSSRAL